MEGVRKETLLQVDLEKMKEYSFFRRKFNSDKIISKYNKLFNLDYDEKDVVISELYGKGINVNKEVLQKLFERSKSRKRR